MSKAHSNGNGSGIPAAVYIRMSSDRQDLSPGQQREETAKLAARGGYRIAKEYLDEAISGDRTDRRDAFQQMIRDAAAGKFKAILCWDQDRFGRFDSLEAGFYIHPLRKAGVKLVTVAQGVIDWDDFAGRLVYSVTQEAKHSFLRDLSRNMLRGRIAAAKRGEWLSRPPLGYRVENKRLVLGDPQDVAIVRSIFRDYRSGHSLRAIAVRLNSQGIRTQRGNTWDGGAVKVILTNAAYVGRYVWGDEQCGKYNVVRSGEITAAGRRSRNGDAFVIEDNHPAIIDRKVFDAVQRRLVERRKSTAPCRDGGGFLLTGVCRCGKCGGPMYGSANTGTIRYRCQGYTEKGTCDLNATGQAELLDAVLGAIESRFSRPKTIDRLRAILARKLKERTKAVDVPGLRRQLAKVDNQLATARRNMALAGGDDVRRDYEAVVRELRLERDRLDGSIQAAQEPRGRTQTELDQRINNAVDVLSRLREQLTAAPAVQQRELLRTCIEKVEVWSRRDRAGRAYRLERGIVRLRPDMWFTEAEADNLYSTTRRTS